MRKTHWGGGQKQGEELKHMMGTDFDLEDVIFGVNITERNITANSKKIFKQLL